MKKKTIMSLVIILLLVSVAALRSGYTKFNSVQGAPG